MALDRDLGVVVVRAAREGGFPLSTGWEMTSATGVRGLRVAGEAGPFDRFLLTDAHPSAIEVLTRNAAGRRGVEVAAHDARALPSRVPFDYVDLDPYGSPVPFVGVAVRAVRPGGLLAVTATDMMVLAGAQPGACRRRYGAEPIRGRLGPEGGLRILLAYVAAAARRSGRGVAPLLAYVRDHHVRAYLRVLPTAASDDPVGVIDPARWNGPPVGTGGPYGPLWLGPLFSPELVRSLRPTGDLACPREVTAWTDRLREEAEVDQPFYYEGNSLAAVLRLRTPPPLGRLVAALRGRGYRAARSHVRPSAFRTDAPRPIVEEVAQTLAHG